jgi:anti-anti-sigma factor
VSELEVTSQQIDSTTVVRAVGAVDGNTAPRLQEPLLQAAEQAKGSVRLDLAQVTYISSAALRVLVLAARTLLKRGERLQLANVPPQILTVLNLAGFTSFMDIVA